MATSSRQTALFGVNDWQAIYQTFREADFKSYDYETLRKSFIDYLRAYYPETFNDYIDSSEFIALMDMIAFMGQGIAFRNDLNTRETVFSINFLFTYLINRYFKNLNCCFCFLFLPMCFYLKALTRQTATTIK